jgi:twinkle protein
VIIFGDNDSAGQKMIEETARRLGEYRCKTIDTEHYKDCKDANEIYLKYGKAYVIDAINNAKDYQISGLIKVADAKAFDLKSAEKVLSGIDELDEFLSFFMGQVTIWTGINSSGKSTFINQILIESIDQDYSVCAYSGELPASVFRYWVELQMAGAKNIVDGKIKNQECMSIRQWYKDKFYFMDCFNNGIDDDILRTFEYVYKRYNVKIFLVDNLMSTVYSDINEKDFFRRQSGFVGKLVNFAHKHNVHVHLVAHPKKVDGRVTKMDVAGLAEITNRVDNVISMHRLSQHEKESNPLLRDYDAIIEVFKNRYRGKQDCHIGLKFDQVSNRFYREKSDKLYGWDLKSKKGQIKEEVKGLGW